MVQKFEIVQCLEVKQILAKTNFIGQVVATVNIASSFSQPCFCFIMLIF